MSPLRVVGNICFLLLLVQLVAAQTTTVVSPTNATTASPATTTVAATTSAATTLAATTTAAATTTVAATTTAAAVTTEAATTTTAAAGTTTTAATTAAVTTEGATTTTVAPTDNQVTASATGAPATPPPTVPYLTGEVVQTLRPNTPSPEDTLPRETAPGETVEGGVNATDAESTDDVAATDVSTDAPTGTTSEAPFESPVAPLVTVATPTQVNEGPGVTGTSALNSTSNTTTAPVATGMLFYSAALRVVLNTTLDRFDDRQFQQSAGTAAGVAPEMVRILSKRAGSVIVDFQFGGTTQAAANKAGSDFVATAPTNSALNSQYPVQSVAYVPVDGASALTLAVALVAGLLAMVLAA